MHTKTVTLLGGALILAALSATLLLDRQGKPPQPEGGAATGSPAGPLAPRSVDCASGVPANPFARCDTAADLAGAAAPMPADSNAADIGKALRALDRGGAANKQPATGQEAALAGQLDEMSKRGNPQAQFELAMQFERSAQRLDQRHLDTNDVAEDAALQRAVALLAQAVAAGNADARQFKDSSDERARLLHTGR